MVEEEAEGEEEGEGEGLEVGEFVLEEEWNMLVGAIETLIHRGKSTHL